MNLAVVIAVAAAAINLSSAILHLAVSRAPGWRIARLPALLSLSAGLYNCGSLFFTLDGMSDAAYGLAARLTYFVAVIHCTAWIVYAHAGEDGRLRETPRWVRWLAGTAVGVGLVFVLTGAHMLPRVEVVEIPWANVRYHYLVTTALGDVYGLTMPALLAVAMLRLARGKPREVGSRRWHLVAFLVFFALAVEEVLVAGRVMRFLSLADVGFVVVVLPLALETVRRVVGDARRLEAASGQLRTLLERLTTERDRAQSALAETAGRLQDMASGLEATVWEADAATMRLLSVGEGAEKLLGFSAREWLERPGFWQRHLHPADREMALAGQRAAAGRDQASVLEYRMLAADGRVVWLRDILHPVADGPDGARRLRGLMVDITESRRAHQALWESEERFRGVFENAGVGLYRTTPEGSILLVNPALVRLLGYNSVEELLERNLEAGGYEPGYARAEFLERIEPTGQVNGLESAWTRRDGTAVYLRECAWAVRGPDGRTQYYDGIVEDVTERRETLAALRESEERYRMLIASANDGVALLKNGRLVEVNRRYCEFVGLSAADLRGTHPADFSPPRQPGGADSRTLAGEVMRRAEAGEPQRCPWTHVRPDGSAVTVEVSLNRLVLQGEVHLMAVLRDITAQLRLEEELRQAQKMESIGRLAGGIAHDFNNLLTVINGFAELALLETGVGGAAGAALSEIRKAGERAAALTQQLLAFSRRQMLQTRVLPLNGLVTDLEQMLRRLIGEDIDLRIELDPAAGHVEVDAGQMQQALMNLAVNARDAMPQGGVLTLRTEAVARSGSGGAEAALVVSDTGCGMTANVRQHLFEPFFTTKPQGTGLGLSTVHGIVHQSGGRIAVESEPGRGTTFRISLPAAARPDEPAPATRPAAAAVRGGQTILVVEDQPEVRKLAVMVLAEHGYRVLSAADGGEALAAAGAHDGPIHLLLTDVVMPHMTGRALAEGLQPQWPEMRVLFMSGYTDDVIGQHGVLDAGVNYIPKPFSPEVLAARVREVLAAG